MTRMAHAPDADQARIAIGFVNLAHALDHYVMLVFPTVVISLELVYGRPYSELIALGTASFAALGIFSLPAGWLADRWSRRNMIALFYFGCGASMVLASLAPNLVSLAAALFALGVFAAIYHPVGTAMLIEKAAVRGRSLAFNGVCGNIGAALAAGISAALASGFGWRAAFLVPAFVCLAAGVAFLRYVENDVRHTAKRTTTAEVSLTPRVAVIIFGLFVLIAVSSGLVFQIVSIALPKIVDERLGDQLPLVLVGSLATAVFMCGAIAQLTVGRLVERFPLHMMFATVALVEFAGIFWAANAGGIALLAALAVAMSGIYAQVTITDLVIARYTADSWRGRVYAVRYFLGFLVAAAAVSAIAMLHARGGFDLVLTATAGLAVVFTAATIAIAVIVHDFERARVAQPAE